MNSWHLTIILFFSVSLQYSENNGQVFLFVGLLLVHAHHHALHNLRQVLSGNAFPKSCSFFNCVMYIFLVPSSAFEARVGGKSR